MKKDFVEKQKIKLIAQRNEILDTLTNQGDQLRKLVDTVESGDVVDVASDAIDRTLLDSLGSQDAQRLVLITNALDRIAQDKYGLCVKCGKPIPEARLDALPYTGLCVACKEGEERRDRKSVV